MIPRRLERSGLVLALATIWLIAVVPSVSAHAELDTMTPADKSTVPPPTQIVATFTENLNPSGSNLVLVNASGEVVAQGGSVDPASPDHLTLDLSAAQLDAETYTVRWTTKSAADGDLDRGTTTFTVVAGPSVAPSASAIASESVAPSAASPASPAPSPSPSSSTGTSASSTGDALIPIVAVLVVLALLGVWLLRGRSRRTG